MSQNGDKILSTYHLTSIHILEFDILKTLDNTTSGMVRPTKRSQRPPTIPQSQNRSSQSQSTRRVRNNASEEEEDDADAHADADGDTDLGDAVIQCPPSGKLQTLT